MTLLLLLNAAAHSNKADRNFVRNVRVRIRNDRGAKSSGEIVKEGANKNLKYE